MCTSHGDSIPRHTLSSGTGCAPPLFSLANVICICTLLLSRCALVTAPGNSRWGSAAEQQSRSAQQPAGLSVSAKQHTSSLFQDGQALAAVQHNHMRACATHDRCMKQAGHLKVTFSWQLNNTLYECVRSTQHSMRVNKETLASLSGLG